MQSVTQVPAPRNEPVHTYAPGSPERKRLTDALAEHAGQRVELTQTIGGVQAVGGGERVDVVMPHRHAHVLGTFGTATHAEARAAADAATAAAPGWAALDYDERAAVFLRAADLLAGPWRETIAAATMLGQSKSVQQAEIDAACELIDFLRFNVHYARRILAEQPRSVPGEWNRMDYRPLDGFVVAITPFNFTAIAGNLPTAPALMGNTVVWKPTPSQQFAAHAPAASLAARTASATSSAVACAAVPSTCRWSCGCTTGKRSPAAIRRTPPMVCVSSTGPDSSSATRFRSDSRSADPGA